MTRQIEAAHSKAMQTQTNTISMLQSIQYDWSYGTSYTLLLAERLTKATELIFENCTLSCDVSSRACSKFIFRVRVDLLKEQEIRQSLSCRLIKEGIALAGGMGTTDRTAVSVFEVLSLLTDLVLKLQPVVLIQKLGMTVLSQLKLAYTWQSAEQPSPVYKLPSSHPLVELGMIWAVPHCQQQADWSLSAIKPDLQGQVLLMRVRLARQVRQVEAVLLQVRQGLLQLNPSVIHMAAALSLYPLLHVQVLVLGSNYLKVVLSQLQQLLDDGPLQLQQLQ